jgi:hypothetical protein
MNDKISFEEMDRLCREQQSKLPPLSLEEKRRQIQKVKARSTSINQNTIRRKA